MTRSCKQTEVIVDKLNQEYKQLSQSLKAIDPDIVNLGSGIKNEYERIFGLYNDNHKLAWYAISNTELADKLNKHFNTFIFNKTNIDRLQ